MRNTTVFWRLIIRWWPCAAEAGVRPVPSAVFATDAPQFYRPHEIDFQHPPSRDDFLAVLVATP